MNCSKEFAFSNLLAGLGWRGYRNLSEGEGLGKKGPPATCQKEEDLQKWVFP